MGRVLLHVNDDGADSAGLLLTRQVLTAVFPGRVVSLATEADGTGMGGAITYPYQRSAITLLQPQPDVLVGTDGTLLDLIRFVRDSEGLRPAMLVAGVNRGCNSVEDFPHSATLMAALWASLHGVEALAISMEAALHDEMTTTPDSFHALFRDVWRSGQEIGLGNGILAINIRSAKGDFIQCESFAEERAAKATGRSSIWRLNVGTW